MVMTERRVFCEWERRERRVKGEINEIECMNWIESRETKKTRLRDTRSKKKLTLLSVNCHVSRSEASIRRGSEWFVLCIRGVLEYSSYGQLHLLYQTGLSKRKTGYVGRVLFNRIVLSEKGKKKGSVQRIHFYLWHMIIPMAVWSQWIF